MKSRLLGVMLATLSGSCYAKLNIECTFLNKELSAVTRYRIVSNVTGNLFLFSQEIEVLDNGKVVILCNNFKDETNLASETCKKKIDETDEDWFRRCLTENLEIKLIGSKTYGIHPSSKETKVDEVSFPKGILLATQQDYWHGINPRTQKIENYGFSKKEEMTCGNISN